MSSAPDLVEPFDAVVVGGGTAGCTVAAVLAGEHRLRVALVERGPVGDLSAPVDPFPAIAAGRGVEQVAVVGARGERSGTCLQAARLGGGGAVNGLIAEMPADSDLELWVREHGCSGWSRDDLSAEIEATALTLPATAAPLGDLGAALCAAAPDGRAATVSLHTDGGPAPLRSSSLDLLHAHVRDGSVTLVEADVSRLVTDGPGVTAIAGGTSLRAGAVVLCAGAFRTPQVLLASGVSHPGLGRNLMNHVGVMLAIDRGHGGAPSGTPPVSAVCDVHDDSGRLGQIIAFEHIDASRRWAGLGAVLLRTGSRGHLAGPSAAVTMPLEADDVAGLSTVAAVAIGLLAGGFADGIGSPDPALSGLAGVAATDLEPWLRANVWHLSHPVGTCAMGPEGVIDVRGRVRGLDSVWVADASVMPRLVASHPNMTVALAARRIARFIAEDLS